MNGTFYDEQGTVVDDEPYYQEHPVFEIGQNGHQDLMFHMSQSVFDSGVKTLVSRPNGLNYTKFYKEFYNMDLNFGCRISQWVNK